jgi:hypothetical protein
MTSTQQIASLSGDNAKGVSLCIPRVFNNIGWRRIKRAFIALNWGFVERVDVIPSGGTKRAFVHFAPGKFTADTVLTALCEGKQVKVVYDEPWYWNIALSRSKKPDEAPKPAQRPQVQITAAAAAPTDASTNTAPALTRQTADMTDEHEESKVADSQGADSRGAVALALGEDFGQCSIDSHYAY